MTTAWPEVALGEVCLITMGQAPSGESYNSEGDGWPLISGAGDFHNGLPKAKKFTSVKTKLCEPGDIVLGIRASIGSKVLADKIYCLGRGVAGLRASVDLEERYLWHWLDAVAEDLAAQGRGATFKQVNKNDVAELKIPLPPLDEQRRIAAILDKADEVRAKRKAALETLETLSQAIFIEMFGEPGRDLNSTMLSDQCDILVGYPFKSSLYVSDNTGVKLCRGANVLPGRVDWSDIRRYPAKFAAGLDEFLLAEGDVVLAMDRPWISEGLKVAVVGSQDSGSLLVQRVARLRPKSGTSSEFLYQLLVQQDFQRHCKPTETTIPHISPSEIRNYRFSEPGPLDLSEFKVRTDQIRQSMVVMAKCNPDDLFSSLQQKAFQGAL